MAAYPGYTLQMKKSAPKRRKKEKKNANSSKTCGICSSRLASFLYNVKTSWRTSYKNDYKTEMGKLN